MLGAIITEVSLIDRITRSQHTAFHSSSLPGHLIHICIEGEVEQRAGGVRQTFGAGQAIWYHENEPVRGIVLHPPWEFFTVNFQAPSLPPPPPDRRVCNVSKKTIERMERLLQIWRATNNGGLHRQLQVHALLLKIIFDLIPPNTHHRIDSLATLWWQIESIIRSRLDEPVDLKMLEKVSGHSRRQLANVCKIATGLSPMKRVKQMRLSYARGLVQHSELSMTEIALRVGYTRVQEFSRDYNTHFGQTPTNDRAAGPDFG